MAPGLPGQLDIFGGEVPRGESKRAITPPLLAAAERQKVLDALRHEGLATVSDLASASGLPHAVVTLRLRALQRDGLVRARGRQQRLSGGYDSLWGLT